MSVRARQYSGFAMALVLMVLALITVVLGNTYTIANFSQRVSLKFQNHAIASEAASAGLAHAIDELRQNPAWSEGFAERELDRSGASYTVTMRGKTLDRSINNIAGTEDILHKGRLIPTGCVYLLSVGKSSATTSRAESLVRITAIPPLRKAVATQNKLSVEHSSVEGYNSSSRGARNWRGFGADISTNLGAKASVVIKDSVLRGHVVVGPGGGPETVRTKSSVLLGRTVVAPVVTEFAAPRFPMGESAGDVHVRGGKKVLSPGVYGKLVVSQATLVLGPGDYSFSGIQARDSTIRQPDKGKPTYLYTTGRIDLRNTKLRNRSRIPNRFWFISHGDDVILNEIGKAHLVVYAPNSTVKLDQSHFFGALVGSEVRIRDTREKYDRNLATTPGPVISITILARWGD